ncbi:MAG: hypothetical protein ACJAWQ_000555 [Paraglaciecola sp.]|jgi:hypothetical protein|uniref:hypothetical protein n=1 Tax=uncultured Paraglaciecola sp. TaxID=1765024 RepID=UPI0025F4DE0C|nr:hypothetical protein [uncultured Paraglaciecola sp.]
MAKSLVDFLEELDSNAELKESYLKDPVATAKNYGLTDEEVAIIKNKDWDTVRKQFENLGSDPKVHTH